LAEYQCISGNVTNAINNAIVNNGNGSNPILDDQTYMNMTINEVAGCLGGLTHLIHHTTTTTVSKTLTTGTLLIPAISHPNTKSFLTLAISQAKQDGSVGIRDSISACANLNINETSQCVKGYNQEFNKVCLTGKFGCNE
jgi:hypothetical protein